MGFVLTRKVLVGSMAVTLALGAGTTVAFAATSKGSTPSQKSPSKQGMYHHGAMMGTQMMADLASKLKLSTSTLQADFKSGKTISEIASAQKIPTSTLISELESTLASQQTSHVDKQVTDFVNGTMPKLNGHGPGKVGAWGPGHGLAGPGGMMSGLASDLKLSSSQLQADLKAGKTISEIASAQGVKTSTLVSELEATLKTQLTKAEASGKITSAQETKMVSNMDKLITNFVNGTMPKFNGHGPGKFGAWGHGPGLAGSRGMISGLASDLKLSNSQLQADFKAGKTVSEIASAQGVKTSTLISELESTMKSQLSKAEASGKITSAQEAKMVSNIDQQVTDFVNGTMPKFNGHGAGKVGAWGPGPGLAGPGGMMSALASDLNLSSSQLQADIKAGKTISEIASAQGVKTSTVISKLESQVKSQMTSRIDAEVTKMVNSTTPPKFGMGHKWHEMPQSSNSQTGRS